MGLGGADYASTVIDLGGTAYTVNDTLTAAAGTSCEVQSHLVPVLEALAGTPAADW